MVKKIIQTRLDRPFRLSMRRKQILEFKFEGFIYKFYLDFLYCSTCCTYFLPTYFKNI